MIRHRMRLFTLAVLAAFGCGDTVVLTPTQTIVVVDGEDGVREQTDSLLLVVRSKDDQTTLYQRTFERTEGALKWPHSLALEPRDGDTDRQFEVTATASAADGSFVARAVGISGYVRHKQLQLRLLLEDDCIGVSTCTATQTCRGGNCEDAFVDPSELAEFDQSKVDDRVEVPGTDMPVPKMDASEPVDMPDTSMVENPDTGTPPNVMPGCTANPDTENEVCPEICPEICNNRDDDCDRMIDEGDPDKMCDLGHADGVCVKGTCIIEECLEDYRNCDADASNGCEVAPDDLGNCGGCGIVCAFEHAATLCVKGQCLQVSCEDTYGDCDSDRTQCETLLRTVEDCGSCGNRCDDFAHATATCNAGTCEPDKCLSGYDDCNGQPSDGCEQALNTVDDCGDCGATCDLSGSVNDSCSTGACVAGTCGVGYDDCDGDLTDGCESLSSDAFCGTCGVSCEQGLDHVTSAACNAGNGTCDVVCETGYDDCNTDSFDGCEAQLGTDTRCRTCAESCVNAFANASATCKPTTGCEFVACDDGWEDCDGNPVNGCEQDLDSDEHCGACDMDCTATAAPYCSGRACTGLMCGNNLADCDGDGLNCETDTTTSAEHCGACDFVCQFTAAEPHATDLACANSQCAVTCADGYEDCNGDYHDGCEADLNSVANCGGCEATCSIGNAEEACVQGDCQVAQCDADYGDCDFDQKTCETMLDTANNCGGCGVKCARANAQSTCGGSEGQRVCEIAVCDSGFADCDDTEANGCEVDVLSPANCGGCASKGQAQTCQNLPHVADTACTTGTCEIAQCAADWVDCDGNVSNGCEQQLSVVGPCFPDSNCTKVEHDAHSYFFCDNSHSWSEARALCQQQLLGDLVRVDGDAENVFLRDQIAGDAWLGANDQSIEGQFRWADNGVQFWQGTSTGSVVGALFNEWSSGEPNDSGANEDCVAMVDAGLTAGFWEDRACGNAHGFVCEVQGDLCPGNPAKADPGQCGCAAADTDADSDGTADCNDECPNDPLKVTGGMCGCGVTDVDSDMDLSPDCLDGCDGDPLKSAPGVCGCGVVDSSTDGDGDTVPDCLDACPLDNTRSTAPCGNWTGVSNVDPSSFAWGTAPSAALTCGTTIVDTSTTPVTITNWCGTAPIPEVHTQASGPDIVVLPLRGLTIDAGQTLRLIGTRPVMLAVEGAVTINGTVDASASGVTPGAGAGYTCGSSAGGNGGFSSPRGAGGGGGGYGTVGGAGGTTAFIGGASPGAAGAKRGNANLVPLYGGCGGGNGGGCAATGAAGGGAVQISATATMTLSATATLTARGGAGLTGCATNGGGGGGGSGGSILLEAPVIKNVGANVVTSGGKGGDGLGVLRGTGGAGSNDASAAGTAGNDGTFGAGGGGGGGYGRLRMRTIGDGGRKFADWTASNFTPQSYTYVRDVLINCNAVFDSTGASPTFTTWCVGTKPTPVIVSQAGGPDAVLVPMKSFTVEQGFTLVVKGSRPVIFAVDGDVAIYGAIDAAATKNVQGAGGNTGCSVGTGSGGNGSHDTSGDDGSGGGGGGGNAAVGGSGGGGHSADSGAGGVAGAAMGTALLKPLRGGCPGGTGGGQGATAGAGGGGLQLSARTMLFVAGTIDVSGGGGQAGDNSEDGGGGGGSAGNLLLEGDTYRVMGTLRATGGGGARGNRTSAVTGVDGTDGRTGGAGSASFQGGGGGGGGGAAGLAGSVGASGAAYTWDTGNTDGNGNPIFATDNGAGGGGGGGSGGRIVTNAATM